MPTMRLLFLLFLFIYPSYAFAELENLDEVFNRKSRAVTLSYEDNAAVILEDSGNGYIWQPETLIYIDITTGHEVQRITPAGNVYNEVHDISCPQFSADGKRFAFGSKRNTESFDSPREKGNGVWMVCNTDGTNLRPMYDGPARTLTHSSYMTWNPIEPEVYFKFGRNYTGEGFNAYDLYKVTVSDASVSNSLHLEFPSGELNIKKSISSDGTQIWVNDFYRTWAYPATVYPDGSKSIDDADGYTTNRPSYDSYWGDTGSRVTASDSLNLHDQYMTGSGSDIWVHILPESTNGTWWKIKLTGTETDGGPKHTSDNSPPYVWGGEMEPTNTITDDVAGNDPYQSTNYFSHYTPDRWGRYIIFTNSQTSALGTGIWDESDHTFTQRGDYEQGDGQHHDWHAFSDWSVSSIFPDGVVYADQIIATQKYNDSNSQYVIASAHIRTNGGDNNYESLARPTQSPDGTKVTYHSTFLNSSDLKPDIFQAVAYYPYAPEIISVSSGVVRFDWRTDQTTSRGYTQRGWPNESTDDPPPPREVKEVRLWKSANGTTGWAPVDTVTVDLWSRYDYSDGTWSGNKYFEITDPSPSGYYAVTTIENSGLESRTLSNVFNAAGSQTAAYPADPGGDDNIISTYNSDAHRYYNIHAADGSTPAISQTTRIASDPRTTKEFIDVFGKDDDTTLYTVTAVDTQGNESAALDVTVDTDTPSAGLYTITWTDATGPPTVTSTTINASAVVINFSEACTRGIGYTTGDLKIDLSTGGSNKDVTYVSRDGTNQWNCTIVTTAVYDETALLEFNGAVNSIENSGGEDMEAFSDDPVVNNTPNPITPTLSGWAGSGCTRN